MPVEFFGHPSKSINFSTQSRQIIIAGTSAYSRDIDYARMREVSLELVIREL